VKASSILSAFFAAISVTNGQSISADSVLFKTYLQVELSSGKIIKLYDGDSITNRPDTAVAACLKVFNQPEKSITDVTVCEAVFSIFSKEPAIVVIEGCLSSKDLMYYNRLMNPIGDHVVFRNIKLKYAGSTTRSLYPLTLGGKRKP
jgi:hypothetical protein